MEIVWIIMLHFLSIKLSQGVMVNIALNKPATMSSVHSDARFRFTAKSGVDGNSTTVFPKIINTAEHQNFAWWMVDLQTKIQGATVKIYFRTDYQARRNGVQFYTSKTSFSYFPGGQLCYSVIGRSDGADIQNVVSVNCNGTWRYLLVYTDTDNDSDGPVLDFAEVKVFVCSVGTYGLVCSKSCDSRQCAVASTSCDRYTGACSLGCKGGWMGSDCTEECEFGAYGPGCIMSCRDRNCENPSSSCDRVTGKCVGGCSTGWKGSGCTTSCPSGTYGPGCRSICGNCTGDDICNHETGNCPGDCKPGWRGRHCKQTFSSGKYGVNCVENCGHCNGTCDVVDGRCPGGCLKGYSGTQCRDKIQDEADDSVRQHSAMSLVIGAVIGSGVMLVVMLAVCGGLHIVLIRCGRLQWISVSGVQKESVLLVDV